MAPVMAFMAVKMFWKMHLAKVFLSSSEKPRPWMILICRRKVVLPLSPVPDGSHGEIKLTSGTFRVVDHQSLWRVKLEGH